MRMSAQSAVKPSPAARTGEARVASRFCLPEMSALGSVAAILGMIRMGTVRLTV
jgi:hypothetical protein